jgi:hypothetical protein
MALIDLLQAVIPEHLVLRVDPGCYRRCILAPGLAAVPVIAITGRDQRRAALVPPQVRNAAKAVQPGILIPAVPGGSMLIGEGHSLLKTDF